jgi:predicted PurR-regulated permease PerM
MKLSEIAKKMVYAILVISLVCIIASIIYYRSLGFLPFLFGVLLGSVCSILKVFLLDRTVDKALAMDRNEAKNYTSLHHLLRLLISAVVLIIGVLVPQISLWGVVAGIFAFQLAAYSVRFTTKA